MSSKSYLPQPPLSGSCQCGLCCYTIDLPPLSLYVCHCTCCQQQSASAHGISLIVPSEGFHLSASTPPDAIKVWTRPTDRGGTLDCHFCSDCGVRLWHSDGAASGKRESISVKAGTLDVASKAKLDLSKAVHIWVKRKLKGVEIPAGSKTYAEGPPEDD